MFDKIKGSIYFSANGEMNFYSNGTINIRNKRICFDEQIEAVQGAMLLAPKTDAILQQKMTCNDYLWKEIIDVAETDYYKDLYPIQFNTEIKYRVGMNKELEQVAYLELGRWNRFVLLRCFGKKSKSRKLVDKIIMTFVKIFVFLIGKAAPTFIFGIILGYLVSYFNS